jgi:hypothetical protein
VPAAAEDPVITRVVIYRTKPGMAAKLEAGIKLHNALHVRKADPLGHETFEVISGPNTGNYVRVAGGRNWKDFDAENAWQKEDAADSALNTDPYVSSVMPMYYRTRLDLSHGPLGKPAPLYALTFLKLRIGKVDDYEAVVKQSKAAADKANWPRFWTIFTLLNGGDGPQWVISQARQSFAEFNPPDGKIFGDMLEEQLGKDAARLQQEDSDASIEAISTEMIAYRPDLTYTPAAK